MARVQVLHEHEGHARVVRKRSQELPECVQSACRGPHADDGESAPGAEARPAGGSSAPSRGQGPRGLPSGWTSRIAESAPLGQPPIPRPSPGRGGGARRSTCSRGRSRRPPSPVASPPSRTVATASWRVGSKGRPTLSNDLTPSASSRLLSRRRIRQAGGHRVRRVADVSQGASRSRRPGPLASEGSGRAPTATRPAGPRLQSPPGSPAGFLRRVVLPSLNPSFGSTRTHRSLAEPPSRQTAPSVTSPPGFADSASGGRPLQREGSMPIALAID